MFLQEHCTYKLIRIAGPGVCCCWTGTRERDAPATAAETAALLHPFVSSPTRFCGMIRSMAKSPPNFEVTCPCCSALLKIDVETRAVIAHTAAVKPKTF